MTAELPPDWEKEFTALTGGLDILTRPRNGVECLLLAEQRHVFREQVLDATVAISMQRLENPHKLTPALGTQLLQNFADGNFVLHPDEPVAVDGKGIFVARTQPTGETTPMVLCGDETIFGRLGAVWHQQFYYLEAKDLPHDEVGWNLLGVDPPYQKATGAVALLENVQICNIENPGEVSSTHAAVCIPLSITTFGLYAVANS